MKKLIPNNIFTYHVKNVVKNCTESVYLRVFIVHYFLAWWRIKLFFSFSLPHSLSFSLSLAVYCKYVHRSETLSASHHVRGFSWQTRKRKSNIIIVSAHMLNETSSSPFTIRSEKNRKKFSIYLMLFCWCCCCCYYCCLKSGAAVVKSVATLYLWFVDVYILCMHTNQIESEPKPAHFNSSSA